MIDLSKLKPGMKGSAELVVGEEHTAPRVGSGRVHVLATPVMINLIEAAALAAAENLLPPGHQSLGIRLDVRHFAATPVGMRVTATAEIVKVDGRTVSPFASRPATRRGADGDGTHERVVVNVERFAARVQRKIGASGMSEIIVILRCEAAKLPSLKRDIHPPVFRHPSGSRA